MINVFTGVTDTHKALINAVKDFLTANEVINANGRTYSGLPIIDEGNIAWENRSFTPEGKPLWVSVFYSPNIPQGRTVGFGGLDDFTGFVQIDFNITPDEGENGLWNWEEKGLLYFYAGRAFEYEAHSVLVTSCGMSQGRHVENFYRKSLTISFRSQLKRNKID